MVRLIKAIQSLFYLPLILMRSNTRGSKVNAIALIKSHPAGAHQRQDGVERHGLLVLVEDLHSPFHHAGGFFLGSALFLQRFTFTGQAHLMVSPGLTGSIKR